MAPAGLSSLTVSQTEFSGGETQRNATEKRPNGPLLGQASQEDLKCHSCLDWDKNLNSHMEGLGGLVRPFQCADVTGAIALFSMPGDSPRKNINCQTASSRPCHDVTILHT